MELTVCIKLYTFSFIYNSKMLSSMFKVDKSTAKVTVHLSEQQEKGVLRVDNSAWKPNKLYGDISRSQQVIH